jgi:2-keto-4-pentenoate hydratase
MNPSKVDARIKRAGVTRMKLTIDDPRILRGMALQLGRRRDRLNAGQRPLGWKVGFGAPAALQKFGTVSYTHLTLPTSP